MLRKRFAWSLVVAASALACPGCGSDDGSRWEPHVVPTAKPEEKPPPDRKPGPELKLKRAPGQRI